MRRTLIAGLGGAGLILTLGLAVGFPDSVFGQSGTRSRASSGQQPGAESERTRAGQSGTRQNAESSTKAPYETRLWNWLQQAQYRNWAPPAGVTGEAYAGQSPHGDMVKLYANRTAVATADSLPVGSMIVKENFGPDGTTLMAVTLMYRVEGFDPEHGDWYWAKYEADGQVSRMDGMAVAGTVGMCIDCHSSAAGNDYSFANDR
ncbi:MAG: cytochrome P460 family protein [Planctomyces sp.]|nr:cytochrome P460 family protein [Planctomyces sp.]